MPRRYRGRRASIFEDLVQAASCCATETRSLLPEGEAVLDRLGAGQVAELTVVPYDAKGPQGHRGVRSSAKRKMPHLDSIEGEVLAKVMPKSPPVLVSIGVGTRRASTSLPALRELASASVCGRLERGGGGRRACRASSALLRATIAAVRTAVVLSRTRPYSTATGTVNGCSAFCGRRELFLRKLACRGTR